MEVKSYKNTKNLEVQTNAIFCLCRIGNGGKYLCIKDHLLDSFIKSYKIITPIQKSCLFLVVLLNLMLIFWMIFGVLQILIIFPSRLISMKFMDARAYVYRLKGKLRLFMDITRKL